MMEPMGWALKHWTVQSRKSTLVGCAPFGLFLADFFEVEPGGKKWWREGERWRLRSPTTLRRGLLPLPTLADWKCEKGKLVTIFIQKQYKLLHVSVCERVDIMEQFSLCFWRVLSIIQWAFSQPEILLESTGGACAFLVSSCWQQKNWQLRILILFCFSFKVQREPGDENISGQL